jgi:hypothetical protein
MYVFRIALWSAAFLCASSFGILSGDRKSANVAVAATPTPLGIAFDQIDRVVMGDAPSPGSFQSDYAQIKQNAANAQASTPRRGGIGGMLGGAIGIDKAMENAMAAFSQGHLERRYYLNGWERIDDPIAQTASILKCDLNQYIALNLAKKTYRIAAAADAPGARAMPGPPGRPPSTASQPGTATVDLTRTTTVTGPKTIENVATTGYDATMSMKWSNSTGSCSGMSASMRQVTYITDMGEPRAVCPARAAQPTGPEGYMAQGGCKPTFTQHQTGPTIPDRFYMYRLMAMGAGDGSQPGGFGQLSERGNLQTLTAADLSVFEIPAGFTKE